MLHFQASTTSSAFAIERNESLCFFIIGMRNSDFTSVHFLHILVTQQQQ